MTSTTSSPSPMIGEITRRFSGVEPDEFRSNMHGLWQAAQVISQSVADQVEERSRT